jgi:Amt family ammonium transporter
MEAHDITMVVVGAALLWFGWFGFNAGSALGANTAASNAFVVTHIAAAAAMVTWVGLSWLVQGKPSVIGAAAGAVAGLVAITPAAGAVDAMGAIAVGGGAGALCYAAVRMRTKIGIDDSLDVVGVHGVGGAWGAIATGIFATATITGGPEGLLHGDGGQFVDQVIGVAATMTYSLVVTYILLKVLDMVFGLRVTEDAEIAGLDVSEHGERAYILDGGSPYAGIPVTPEAVSGGGGS